MVPGRVAGQQAKLVRSNKVRTTYNFVLSFFAILKPVNNL